MASTSGNNNPQYDPNIKAAAALAVYDIAKIICTMAGKPEKFAAKVYDLDFSNQLEGAVSSAFQYMRKNKQAGSTNEAKSGDNTVNIGGTTNPTLRAIEAKYVADKKQPIDFLTATPIANMHTAFKVVRDEVRVGVTQIIRKEKEKRIVTSITNYGLGAHHAPYLKYLTLAPERRSGLMKCMGPLALCINLINDKKFPDKPMNALKVVLKHLPMCNAIIECCRLNRLENMGNLLGALGDVLLLTTDRAHNKSLPPLLAVLGKYEQTNMDGDLFFNHQEYANTFDFSGKGSVLFYRDVIQAAQFKWLSDGTGPHSSQVFFHSCQGTYLEDLGVLAQTTSVKTWNTRKEMSNVFTKAGKKSVTFSAPKLERASKMASACGTRLMGTVEPMVQCRPVYSGKRKRHFSSELTAILSKSRTGAYSYDVPSLTKSLVDLKTQIMNERLNPQYGTTDWYNINDVTIDDWGTPLDDVVEEKGLYFYA